MTVVDLRGRAQPVTGGHPAADRVVVTDVTQDGAAAETKACWVASSVWRVLTTVFALMVLLGDRCNWRPTLGRAESGILLRRSREARRGQPACQPGPDGGFEARHSGNNTFDGLAESSRDGLAAGDQHRARGPEKEWVVASCALGLEVARCFEVSASDVESRDIYSCGKHRITMSKNSPHPDRQPQTRADSVTMLLVRAGEGDATATAELLPLVYDELRELAAKHLGGERASHTLQPTALVHEAYLRLVGPAEVNWDSRAHFFGAAARAIRRILIDYARARDSDKRGGSKPRVSIDELQIAAPAPGVDLLALDSAIDRLARLDAQKSRVVELRYFAGLTVQETALSLGVSPSTVARDWEFARVWLRRELSRGEPV